MGTFHTYEDLKSLLACFALDEGKYTFNRIDQGYINDTYLVLEKEDPLFILQRINSKVFTDVAGVMGNMTKALTYLSDEDYRSVALVPTKTRKSYCDLNNQEYWRLMEYIPNSLAFDNAKNSEIAYEAGRILGKFHSLLQHAPSNQFTETIPQFHDLELRKEQFQDAMNNASHEKQNAAASAISFAKETFPLFSELYNLDLPFRLCHNDTKLNNILFSKKTNKALCFIDLDTIMKGYFYYDFGDLVRTIANTAKEDEKEHHKITFDQQLFESFLDGLGSTATFLTTEELKSLPLGTIFMPFIHGLRALTDYLNNNQYYKVSYPTQNLERSLSLFDFCKKALGNMDYIKGMVANKLHANGN
ncbi:aminoglycoside phosphotransferase family protein [Flavobacteriaceae bacterium KMM 6897]|nr:aminoglycoside phosphotransferase family protein [Flavobacteriaceae bacterium KMM 6897]